MKNNFNVSGRVGMQVTQIMSINYVFCLFVLFLSCRMRNKFRQEFPLAVMLADADRKVICSESR